MSTLFSQLHPICFQSVYTLSSAHPEWHRWILFVADTIDLWVVAIAILTLALLVFSSVEGYRWKRVRFLIREGIRILVSVGIAWGVSWILKHSIHAARPFLRFPNEVEPLFHHGGYDSFPSGHATLFMALGVMIYLHHRKLGFFFIVLAFLISIARVASGVHYPLDILAGWIIGGGVSLFVYYGSKKAEFFLRRALKKRKKGIH